MTTLSVVVLVAATVLVASAADDFCKAANHRDRVRCDKDTLTWCKGESVAATKFCGQSNCVNGAWSKSSDPAINAVPSYCKQFTKEFFLQQMGPERERKWGCHDTMQTGDSVAKLTDDDKAKLLRDDNWKTNNPRYLCESGYLDGSSDDNTHDFIFQDITPEPVESLPLATLVGIEVTVRARTLLRPNGKDDGNLIQRCYFSSVELLNGRDSLSDNRGADQLSPRVAVGTQWTDVTFGDHRDLWDEFEDLAMFKLTPKVEIDMLAHWFDNTTLQSVSHPDHKPTDVRCQVAGAKIRLHYVQLGMASYEKLVVDSHENVSATWWYFNPRDASSMGEGDILPNASWKAIDFVPLGMHGWEAGQGSFGYGSESAQEHTRISSRRLSSFFRTSFNFTLKRADVKALKITALIDDGAVLYLNGQPLWWFNFEIEKYGLPAMDATSIRQVLHEETPKTAILPGNLLLLDGVNVLAAEVHQVHKDSSDLLFDLELAAVISHSDSELPTPEGTDEGIVEATDDTANTDAPPTTTAATINGTAVEPPSDATSVLTTVVLAGAIIGLLLFFLYMVWQRLRGRRRAAVSSRGSLSFAQYVPEDVQLEAEEREPPSKAPVRPTLAATEPELKRPEFAAAPESGTATTTGGLGTVQKKKHAPEDWDDF